jgi:N-methylhydantoinase A
MLMADVVLEQSRSVLEPISGATVARLQRQLDAMAFEARARLVRDGIEDGGIVLLGLVDARYKGQSHELTIPLERGLTKAFHAAHAEAYGHAMPDRTVEVVNLRLQATGLVKGPELVPEPVIRHDGREAILGEKTGFLDRIGFAELVLYERGSLQPGAVIRGPALVRQMDSTTFVSPSWAARVDGYRNLVLEKAR